MSVVGFFLSFGNEIMVKYAIGASFAFGFCLAVWQKFFYECV